MQLFDGENPTSEGTFTDGEPGSPHLASVPNAATLNAMLMELANMVTGSGLALDAGDSTQVLQASRRIAGQRADFTNALLNGDMEVWQRATTFPAVGDTEFYTADRWYVRGDESLGAGNVVVTREQFDPGVTLDGVGFENYLRLNQSIAATAGNPFLGQRVESVRAWADGQATLSFWAKATTALACAVQVEQNFGSGGSAAVMVHDESVTIGTTWQRYSFEISLPNVVGKTVGLSNYLQARLNLPTGLTYLCDTVGWQLELGQKATPFVRRPFSVELRMCQRFFEKSWGHEDPQSTATTASQAVGMGLADAGYGVDTRFAAHKRAQPTLRFYSPVTGTIDKVRANGADQSVVGITGTGAASTGYPSTSGGLSGHQAYTAHWTADAELY